MRILKTRGFTILELIVVVAVLGILVTIATVGLNRFLVDGRDANRVANVTTLTEALEKYYDENGEYPGCTALTAPANTVVTTTLAGLDPSALVTPNAPSGTTNSIQCTDLTAPNGTDYIAYIGDGSTSCATTSCLEYTLKYIDESEATVVAIDSRRQTNINTSGAVALSGGATGYTSATVNWGTIANSTGYTVQRDTSSAFNTGNLQTIAMAAGTTSHQSTNLAPSTTYYYRVQVVSSTGTSAWSNTVSRVTTTLPTPTLSSTQNTPSQVTANWTAGSGITSYTIQRGSSVAFGGGTYDEATGNFTNRVYSDTPINTARHYRVRVNTTNSAGTTYNGAWSNIISYTSFVPAPTAPTIAAALSGTDATGTSGTVTCTQGGVPQYSLREARKTNSANPDSWNAWTAWSPSTMTYTVGALQGHQHKFESRASCLFAGVYSTAVSSTTSAAVVRSILTPAAPTWPSGLSKTWYDGVSGNYMWYGTYCPAGTWAGTTWYHSQAWPTATPVDYYHEFGFNDYWYLGPVGGANVFYEARYTCASSYTTSAWSPLSADTIWVAP